MNPCLLYGVCQVIIHEGNWLAGKVYTVLLFAESKMEILL
jgi:hypothetical protein